MQKTSCGRMCQGHLEISCFSGFHRQNAMGRTCKVLTQVLDGNLAEVDGLRYRFAGSSVSATKYDFDMCDLVYCFLNLMNPYVCYWTNKLQYIITLWLFNIAMETDPFIDDFPSYKPPFISGIFPGYVSHNQMVIVTSICLFTLGLTLK